MKITVYLEDGTICIESKYFNGSYEAFQATATEELGMTQYNIDWVLDILYRLKQGRFLC